MRSWNRVFAVLLILIWTLWVGVPRALCQNQGKVGEPSEAGQASADPHFEKAKQFLLDRGLATEKRIDQAVERRGRAAVVEFARRNGWQADRAPGRSPEQRESDERQSSVGLTPLTELGNGRYKGFRGGLYPGGKNTPPEAHLNAALGAAATIQPLDGEGRPSKEGKVVMISNGMSNTTQEFRAFMQLASQDPDISSNLKLVDCAQGGMEASMWAYPDYAGKRGRRSPWEVQQQRLKAAGVTPEQVQVVWMLQARARPEALGEFPEHAEALKRDLAVVLHKLRARFPNLRLAYLSSRIYAGYATTRLNPEPYAYESAFSVRWLIGDQISGDPSLNPGPARDEVRAPLLLWGPYLWADGMQGRASDGLIWHRQDLAGDGTHPSKSGREKVARLLLRFFKTDPTARSWFLSPASSPER